MFAATQQQPLSQGTMHGRQRWRTNEQSSPAGLRAKPLPMTAPRQFHIQGITADGRAFRPSDWAERLAGAMSSFRPSGAGGIAAYIGYSPYCVPQLVEGVKCVLVSDALRGIEPMAWDFVMNFARDNGLKVVEVEPRQ